MQSSKKKNNNNKVSERMASSFEKDSSILGIEGTAHTFGVGIVTLEGKVLANEKDEYVPEKLPCRNQGPVYIRYC